MRSQVGDLGGEDVPYSSYHFPRSAKSDEEGGEKITGTPDKLIPIHHHLYNICTHVSKHLPTPCHLFLGEDLVHP
jgi:hypothetical protein